VDSTTGTLELRSGRFLFPLIVANDAQRPPSSSLIDVDAQSMEQVTLFVLR